MNAGFLRYVSLLDKHYLLLRSSNLSGQKALMLKAIVVSNERSAEIAVRPVELKD